MTWDDKNVFAFGHVLACKLLGIGLGASEKQLLAVGLIVRSQMEETATAATVVAAENAAKGRAS